ncbi:MAG: hypothetical protein ABIO43_04475 [Sphingomicrobium sp.]
MTDMADWLADGGMGSAKDSFSAVGLYRRAYRLGEHRAARNLAISWFNQNNLSAYRLWLRRAASAGDRAAAMQLRRFETRMWHSAARLIHRHRPEQKRDESDFLA